MILGEKNERKWSRLDRRKDSETKIQIQICKDTKEIKKVTNEAEGSLSLLSAAITDYYILVDFERT